MIVPTQPRVQSKPHSLAKTTELCLILSLKKPNAIRIGRIMLRTSEEDPALTIHFHGRYSKAKLDDLSTCKWLPTWFQPRDGNIYHKGGILSSSHTAYTNNNTEEIIHESNIICHDLKLTKDWKLSADSARRCHI